MLTSCILSAALMVGAPPAVIVQTRFVTVSVGQTPSAPIVSIPISPAQPPESMLSLPAGPVLVPAPAIPASEFAKSFTPAEGKYQVTLIHPKTCCPVPVCFELPCGCPKKVTCTKHVIRFDYGKHEVTIRFKHDGTVTVKNS